MTDPIVDPLAGVPCPTCGELTLRIETRFETRPLGTWSLAGRQLKTSAVRWPYAVCGATGCDFVKRASVVDRD